MNTKDRPIGKPLDRTYDSVPALLRGEGAPPDVQKQTEEAAYETRLSLRLAKLRQKAGITQQQMAEKIGLTQSAVSKLEAGTDECITIQHLYAYSQATGQNIGLYFGKSISKSEALAMCVESLKERLDQMAESAFQDDESLDKVKAALGEAYSNILNAVLLSNSKLPVQPDDHIQEMRVEIVTGKKVLPPSGTGLVIKTPTLVKPG